MASTVCRTTRSANCSIHVGRIAVVGDIDTTTLNQATRQLTSKGVQLLVMQLSDESTPLVLFRDSELRRLGLLCRTAVASQLGLPVCISAASALLTIATSRLSLTSNWL